MSLQQEKDVLKVSCMRGLWEDWDTSELMAFFLDAALYLSNFLSYISNLCFLLLSSHSLTLSLSLSGSVIEKFTENTRFCLICNYLSKIIPALQSRCTRFRFGPLSPDQMTPRLEHVVQQERCVCVWEKGNVWMFLLHLLFRIIWGRRDFLCH